LVTGQREPSALLKKRIGIPWPKVWFGGCAASWTNTRTCWIPPPNFKIYRHR